MTTLVSAALSANRIPAPIPSRAARFDGPALRAARNSGTTIAALTPPAISHSPIGASSRPPDGSAIVRKRISAVTTSTAAPMSARPTRCPVIFAPSGSAKTTLETSSGWTIASRPMLSAIAWQTKPSASAATPASQTGRRAILSSSPESEPPSGSSMPARCWSTVPSANSSAATRAKAISIRGPYGRVQREGALSGFGSRRIRG